MTVLAAARVVTGADVHAPGWVEYGDARIIAVGAGRPAGPHRDLGAAVVVPGFVDMHVHGGGGGSFTGGDAASALRAVDTHRRHGTTTTMASLVTDRPERLLASVALLAELYEAGEIRGIHLEGPWISPLRPGAHNPRELRDPDPAELGRLLDAGRGAIAMVTLAPELPGGLEAIRQITDAGAVAAVGHTNASYEQVVAAIAAGARVGTHLFNAMAPLHQRHPGPVVALLEDPRVTVELIADGTHLHPALYRYASRSVGANRAALVTDAMAAATLGDGAYELGPVQVTVAGGVAQVTGTDTIAGSTATMDQLFRRAATSPPDAGADPGQQVLPGSDELLLAATRQASVNPASALGWTDVGTLEPGQRADLVILDDDLRLVEVIRRGIGAGAQPFRASGTVEVPPRSGGPGDE